MADGFAGSGTPPPSGPPRRHLVLVALLALGAVALVAGTAAVLLGAVTSSTGPPQSSASPEPAPTVVSEVPSPAGETETGPAPGEALDLDELTDQVAAIRRLPVERRIRSRALDPPALADKISSLAFEELDEEEVEADERLLVALRLATADLDLAGTLERLYREQILGVYVPDERTLYVRGRQQTSPAQQMTTAHEITHALQDQSFDIKQLQERYLEDADASLAVLSLIEGDAVLTQQLWGRQHLSAEQLQDAVSDNTAGGSALDNAPDYLRASLFFPYAEGSLFVAALYRDGGTDAVDAAFEDPPTTSEQIMHPERYTDRDEPTTIRVQTRPDSSWERSATYEFGEFDVQQLFSKLGSTTADAAAAGWDGGQVRSWVKGPDTAVAAALAFDAETDADEACAALRDWYVAVAGGRSSTGNVIEGDRDVLSLRCDGTEVAFALAPTAETARQLTTPP